MRLASIAVDRNRASTVARCSLHAQVFADLVRYETRLCNVLGERLRAEHGLTASQFEFLRIIGDRDDCRVNDLAQEVAITVGATSKGVDRLEAAGWVNRRPNPQNRRSSLLALTEAGRRLLDAATPTFENALRTWLADPLTAPMSNGRHAAESWVACPSGLSADGAAKVCRSPPIRVSRAEELAGLSTASGRVPASSSASSRPSCSTRPTGAKHH
ncbi:MarR family winged helix-turn-helix transcriptional regulator [Streptomyces sp. NPDC059697]|uniref:MarR family winged helix-turn-helix transcriptional regulator n=1 Tax=Streptomyces sp. NPDC059697 TaxID=3346912 RepID=UPI0036D0D7E3